MGRLAQTLLVAGMAAIMLAGGLAAATAFQNMRRRDAALADADAARALAAEEAALRRVASAIASEGDPKSVMALATEEAAALFQTSAAAILRFDRGGDAVIVATADPGVISDGQRVAIREGDVLSRCLHYGTT